MNRYNQIPGIYDNGEIVYDYIGELRSVSCWLKKQCLRAAELDHMGPPHTLVAAPQRLCQLLSLVGLTEKVNLVLSFTENFYL